MYRFSREIILLLVESREKFAVDRFDGRLSSPPPRENLYLNDIGHGSKRVTWSKRVRVISSVSLLCILNILADISWRLYHLHQHQGALLSMDLVGPLPVTAAGYDYILTIMDAFSHYLIAVPIISKCATTVLDAFIQHVVLQGLLPNRITGKGVVQEGRVVTDNGSEFKRSLGALSQLTA